MPETRARLLSSFVVKCIDFHIKCSPLVTAGEMCSLQRVCQGSLLRKPFIKSRQLVSSCEKYNTLGHLVLMQI